MHKKYKYLFQFKRRKMEPLNLHGKSIEDFWNDIYDLFDLEGKMVVERLDGEEFTLRQIKQLFKDLLEDMIEDFSVIDLKIHSLKKIEFTKLVKNFNIKDPELLNKGKFAGLKYCLMNFIKAKENEQNKFFCFYNIIERAKKSGLYNQILNSGNLNKNKVNNVTQILNDPSIKGSRHEGKGIRLRRPTKYEKGYCENTIKKLINGWIEISKINQ